MVSLLCLSLLLSGVLHSHALAFLSEAEFKEKLQDLPATQPVYIIRSNKSDANVAYVKSKLRQVEKFRKVNIFVIYESKYTSRKESKCLHGNTTDSTKKLAGSAAGDVTSGRIRANQTNPRSLDEWIHTVTSATDSTPILVVTIYSQFNTQKISYVKCKIRELRRKSQFIVIKVKDEDLPVITTTKTTVLRVVTTTARSVQRDDTKVDDISLTTTERTVQRKPEVHPEDLTDSGTSGWASSSFASGPDSGSDTRRNGNRPLRMVRSIPDDQGKATGDTQESIVPDTRANNMEDYQRNGQLENIADCELGDVCAFSFAQSGKKVESVVPPSNLHETEPKWLPTQDEAFGLSKTTSFIPVNPELPKQDFHATQYDEERISDHRGPSRHHDGLNIEEGGTGHVKSAGTWSSEEAASSEDDSDEWHSLSNNFPSTHGPTLKDLNIPAMDPSLEKEPESYGNFYDATYETDEKISNVWDKIQNGLEKTKNRIKSVVGNVKDAANNSIQSVKNGFNRLKEFGRDSYKNFINFF